MLETLAQISNEYTQAISSCLCGIHVWDRLNEGHMMPITNKTSHSKYHLNGERSEVKRTRGHTSHCYTQFSKCSSCTASKWSFSAVWSCSNMFYFLNTPVNLAYSVFNVHVKILLKQTTHFNFFFYYLSYG